MKHTLNISKERQYFTSVLFLFLLFAFPLFTPISANAVNYYSVPITSYDAFRSATYKNGYDIDEKNGIQCWDGMALFWQQLGMWLNTGPNHSAKECWTVSRDSNAGDQFELIYNLSDVKRGDVVVLSRDQFGHIAFADEDYYGQTSMSLYGQNQNYDHEPFNTCRYNMSTFLGAFRYKGWSNSDELTISARVTDLEVDISWSHISGATSYYTYTMNLASNTVVYGANLGQAYSVHLGLAEGDYISYVTANMSDGTQKSVWTRYSVGKVIVQALPLGLLWTRIFAKWQNYPLDRADLIPEQE